MKAPFTEWRLFLRSAVVPIIIYGAFMALFFLGLSHIPSELLTLTGYIDLAIQSVITVIFSWSWMTGLWHGETRPHGQNPQLQVQYVLAFTAVAFLSQLTTAIPDEIFSRLESGSPSADHEGYAASQSLHYAQVATSFILGLLSAWVMARLTPWQAWVIDRGVMVGPKAIWHQTKGHAWRIFWIGVAMWLPLGIIAFCVAFFFQTPYAIGFLQYFLGPVSLFYLAAANAAATLLIYRNLAPGSSNELDVF
jgi:hypothetical protein